MSNSITSSVWIRTMKDGFRGRLFCNKDNIVTVRVKCQIFFLGAGSGRHALTIVVVAFLEISKGHNVSEHPHTPKYIVINISNVFILECLVIQVIIFPKLKLIHLSVGKYVCLSGANDLLLSLSKISDWY